MKAVRLFEFDRPPRVEEVPEPRITGPLDVIVRIAGAGVCRTDLHLVEGVFKEGMADKMPFTLGHENAGWIEEVGSGVPDLARGDPVILHPQPSCGLCLACRHSRRVPTPRATYWLCELSAIDPRFEKYPRLPVRACSGYEPRD